MTLSFNDAAIDEVREAGAYYEKIRPELRSRLARELAQAVRDIRQHPLMWPPLDRTARHYLLPKFPYSVVYHVENDHIEILAVMHTARRPRYWKDRLKKRD